MWSWRWIAFSSCTLSFLHVNQALCSSFTAMLLLRFGIPLIQILHCLQNIARVDWISTIMWHFAALHISVHCLHVVVKIPIWKENEKMTAWNSCLCVCAGRGKSRFLLKFRSERKTKWWQLEIVVCVHVQGGGSRFLSNNAIGVCLHVHVCLWGRGVQIFVTQVLLQVSTKKTLCPLQMSTGMTVESQPTTNVNQYDCGTKENKAHLLHTSAFWGAKEQRTLQRNIKCICSQHTQLSWH